ncbi:ATP-binding cassette domain-containing protein [Candidatus Saccharibacteria bacterium]|nr:ATP-binding cassette domain-containing protein [Candidatus Saccharibacteria bacterium]
MTTKNIIEVKNFAMRFGNKTVIRDLSFEVHRGETFGFLGSNGSGKTTTLRALLGIYEPTHGELLINNQPYDVAGKTRIGYLPEERGLYKKESVIDTMVYFGQLKGMLRDDAYQFALEYLAKVGLTGYQQMRLDKLSGGQQQKVQLGITIMGDPELLILDEPTKGFDPVNRRLLMDMIADLRKRGATIMMVSHQMDEIERLCDRVLLLKDGAAKEYGTVAAVRKKYDGAHIEEIFIQIYGDTDEIGERFSLNEMKSSDKRNRRKGNK